MATDDGAVLDLVMPDPGVQALLGDPTLLADPVLAAQAVLGDLATVWREQPVPGLQPDGTETVRGIAVAMPAALPPGIWAPLDPPARRGPLPAPDPGRNVRRAGQPGAATGDRDPVARTLPS